MSARKLTRAKNQRGQELIEVVGGMIFLIPVLLTMLDFAVYMLGQQMADKYTKAAARAAANQGTAANALTAAQNALTGFGASGFITSLQLDSSYGNGGVNYAGITQTVNACGAKGNACVATGSVTVQVKTQLQLPVPIPFAPSVNSSPVFTTQATESVVALPPPNPCGP